MSKSYYIIKLRYVLLFVGAVTLSFIHGYAQVADSVSSKKEKVLISGGVGLSNNLIYEKRFFSSNGIIQESNRFVNEVYLNGGFELTQGALSIPVYFSWSNLPQNGGQPFNQFSINPKYKWIQTYWGYNNPIFSRYTLNGHTILGAGVALTPKKFRFSAMYGRLNQAVEENLNSFSFPSYRRMGFVSKLGYGTQSDYIDLLFFKAKEDSSSIPLPDGNNGGSNDILPQENLVIGVNFRKQILKNLYVMGEYGYSLHTKDLFTANSPLESSFFSSIGQFFLAPKLSTNRSWAFRSEVGYFSRFFNLKFRYERINPEFVTLGALFQNNDYEEFNLTHYVRLLKNKVKLNGLMSYRRNNLNADTIRTTKINRLNGVINLTYMPTFKWIIESGFSSRMGYYQNKPNTLLSQQDASYELWSNQFNAGVRRNFGFSSNKQHYVYSNISHFSNLSSRNQLSNTFDAIYYLTIFNLFGYYNYYGRQGVLGQFQYFRQPQTISNIDGVFQVNEVRIMPSINLRNSFLKNTLITNFTVLYTFDFVFTGEKDGSGATGDNVLGLSFNASYLYKQKHQLTIYMRENNFYHSSLPTSINFSLSFGYNYLF